MFRVEPTPLSLNKILLLLLLVVVVVMKLLKLLFFRLILLRFELTHLKLINNCRLY